MFFPSLATFEKLESGASWLHIPLLWTKCIPGKEFSDQHSVWKCIIYWTIIESLSFGLLLFIVLCSLEEGIESKKSKSADGTKIGSTE